ncbi:hypothetical protein AB0M29_01125 [Streptomyces sp. NPDC051976]|uniref:effector-associated constant component EACC1 n=1 Tax=Streptomyces sp. NPDC051976 TaxID=3154947 RepID=UPI00342BDCC3
MTSSVEISVSDPGEARSLREWLSDAPGVSVETRPGVPGPGEQGVLDSLLMAGSGGALVAALKVVPDFIRSRRSNVSITATVNGQPFTLDAENVEDVMEILERLLDE